MDRNQGTPEGGDSGRPLLAMQVDNMEIPDGSLNDLSINATRGELVTLAAAAAATTATATAPVSAFGPPAPHPPSPPAAEDASL